MSVYLVTADLFVQSLCVATRSTSRRTSSTSPITDFVAYNGDDCSEERKLNYFDDFYSRSSPKYVNLAGRFEPLVEIPIRINGDSQERPRVVHKEQDSDPEDDSHEAPTLCFR